MRRLRLRHGVVVLSMLVVGAALAGRATAADPGLTLTGEVIQAGFQPCPTAPGPPNGFQVCTTPTVQPAKVQASCNPDGTSTMSLETSGDAIGPIPGTAYVKVTVSVGKQDQAPVPDFQVRPNEGFMAGTIGLASGRLTRFTEEFTITSFDGLTTARGTKTLVADLGNTGVCQEFVAEQPPNDPLFGAPLTAYFYIANAQVLSYEATITSPLGTSHDAGVSEAYIMNSFGRYEAEPTSVATSTGSFVQLFGTSRPLGWPQPVMPGKHCGDRNHVGAREGECKKAPK